MKKEDYELHIEPKLSVCDVEIPKDVVIETNHITIKHKDLGFDIDVDIEKIKELHRITINGVSFIREN